MGKQLTQEDFIERSKKIHGESRYDYSSTKYYNYSSSVLIGCPACGLTFSQVAGTHLEGHGCPRCGGREKSSTPKFVEKSKYKFGDKFNYSKVDYKNKNTPVKILCPEHGEFEQTPEVHLNSKFGCPRCGKKYADRNTVKFDEFVARSTEKHGVGSYLYFETSYKTTHEKVMIYCRTCGHVFAQQAKAHMQGRGCPKCSGHAPKTTREVVQKAEETHGNTYDYSETVYVNASTKIKVICRKHGPFFVLPWSHAVRGDGCPKCSKTCKKDFNYFVKKATEKHGSKYDYSKVSFSSTQEKVTILCNTCGDTFSQSVSNHMNGQGCPRCGGRIMKTAEEVAALTKSYGFFIKEYGGSTHSVSTFCCPFGHEWRTTTSNIISGNTGCPICSRYGPSPEYTKNLYLLRIHHEEKEFLGFGVTGDLHKRLSTHKRKLAAIGAKVLDIRYVYFDKEGYATEFEGTLSKRFKNSEKVFCEGFIRESASFSSAEYDLIFNMALSKGGTYEESVQSALQHMCCEW